MSTGPTDPLVVGGMIRVPPAARLYRTPEQEASAALRRVRYDEWKAEEVNKTRGVRVATPEEIEDIRRQAVEDPARFAQWPLGLMVPPHHAEWYTLTQMYKVDPRYRRLIILAPTGFGKTTALNLALPIYEMVKDRAIPMGIIGNSQTNVRSKLASISAQLENNAALVNTYGWPEDDGIKRFKSKKDLKWTLDEIVIAGTFEAASAKGRIMADPTLAAFGWEGKMEGRHWDLAIMDDVVEYKEAQSATYRQQQLDWYKNVLSKRISPPSRGGREIWIGTRAHANDLYNYLIETKQYAMVFMQAIKKNAAGIEVSTWPEEWPIEELLAEREQDPISFMLKRMNIIIGSNMTEFDSGDIQACRDPGLGYHQNRTALPKALLDRNLVIYQGVDLAAGLSKEAKYFVCWVIGVDTTSGDRYLLDLVRGRFPVTVQRQLVRSAADRWVPVEIVVESNAQQRYFYEDAFAGYPIVPMETGREKADLLEGIPSLVALVTGHKLHIPWMDANAQLVSAPFIKELEDYPRGESSDVIMAWWFTERRLRSRLVSAAKIDASRNFLRRGWTPLIQRRPLLMRR